VTDQPSIVEEIWVNVTQAADITGYNRQYVLRLARNLWKLPEKSRPIKMWKRSSGYDLWLPDLMNYIENIGHGPHRKPSNNEKLD